MFIPDPREKYTFKGKSIGGVLSKNQDTLIDFKIDQDNLFFSGAEAIYTGHVFGDKISVYLVDKDNILGMGENTVLNQFLEDWILNSSGLDKVELAYAGKIPVGLYIRFVYTSVGTELDPIMFINLFLHERIS